MSDTGENLQFSGAGVVISTAEAQSFRAARQRRLVLSVLSSLVTRPLSFFIPLITIPLFLRYLGKDGYGLYEVVGALAAYVGTTNVGLSMGLQNKLTDCMVSEDWNAARRYVSSTLAALLIIAVVGIVVISFVVPVINWADLLGCTDATTRHEAARAVCAAAVITLLGLVATAPASVYFGLQEIHRGNIWDACAKIVTLLACFAVCWWTNWGVTGVVLAGAGAPTAVRMINSLFLFTIEKPRLRPALRFCAWEPLKAVASEGILLLVLQTSAILLFQTDKLIVSHFLGTGEVAAYAILGRIFLAGYAVFMLVLTPLWPASGEAIRRGDLAWVRRTLNITQLFGPASMAILGLIVLFGGGWMQYLLKRFSGGETFVLSRSLICAVALTFVSRAWVDCRSISLNSIGVLKPQIMFYTTHAVANLVLAILLAPHFGVEGVAWATPITALLTSVWGYPYLMKRYVFHRRESAA